MEAKQLKWKGWTGNGYVDEVLEDMEENLNSIICCGEELEGSNLNKYLNVERRSRLKEQCTELENLVTDLKRMI